MCILTPFASLVLLAASALGAVSTVSFDTAYDARDTSLSTVACSDGSNGLLTKKFTTFGSLRSFPNIGGAQAVAGWNSPNCGTCWALTFKGKTVNVLAIDHTDSGFNIAKAAMNNLTDNQADFLGRVDATVTRVPASACGL